MRRAFSILLIFTFSLAPLAATLQADDESRLPACCRRLGKHHCAMSERIAAQMMALASKSWPLVTAPAHCPFFPRTIAPCTTSMRALVASAIDLNVSLKQSLAVIGDPSAARLPLIGIRSSRAPPTFTLD